MVALFALSRPIKRGSIMCFAPAATRWYRGLPFAFAASALISAFFCCHRAFAGDAARDSTRFQAHLKAGEFAPATQLARQLPPTERDARLAQIAEAQNRVGAWDASLYSAGGIGDDRARADSLSRLGGRQKGAHGGNSQADFDSLIDLITKTIKPTTWDGVGGTGSIQPFPSGVWIDSHGLLQPLMKADRTSNLASLASASARAASGNKNVRRSSELRNISLTRLEKKIQLLEAAGQPLPDEMQVLAGLQRIEYVFAYPDSGDFVIAGPAGDWLPGPDGTVVSRGSGRPPVRLDDLVIVFRHMISAPEARFGCLITPRQEGLARVHAFLEKPMPMFASVRDRQAFSAELRGQLGRQDIEIYGLDPRTRAAHVMIEADYRMKLVGMGLEEGVPGVKSYLDLIQIPPGGSLPPMSVLRWWFTLDYQAIVAAGDRHAFALEGPGVKVESENERLTAEGKRVHTGQSDDLNRQFARSFTEHLEPLAAKYPIYAELRNLCDLALVGTLVREEKLAEKVNWHMTLFGNAEAFPTQLGPPPKEVESVINFRTINDAAGRRVHTVFGVSGGVAINPVSLVRGNALREETDGAVARIRSQAVARPKVEEAWWWD
jgi:hypothetical protein